MMDVDLTTPLQVEPTFLVRTENGLQAMTEFEWELWLMEKKWEAEEQLVNPPPYDGE